MQIVSQHNHNAEALLRCGEQKKSQTLRNVLQFFAPAGPQLGILNLLAFSVPKKKHATTNEHIQILAPH